MPQPDWVVEYALEFSHWKPPKDLRRIVLDAYLAEPRQTSDDPYALLTEREREVLVLVAQGKSTREIANILKISPNTLDVHRARLMQKLDLHGVAEVSAYAVRRGLVGS